MKKTIKTEVILAVYRLLTAAKCSKMDDDDKIKVWKIQRAMKPVAEQFQDDVKTSSEKLRPEGYDDALAKAQNLEQKERKAFGELDTQQKEREFVDMLMQKDADYAKFQEQQREYARVCNDALREYANKEVELDYEPITEEAFAKLFGCNDWTFEQAGFLADHICE